uniref:Uncharacterized protein n=1 Tax=Molossus molossus TaxID=27622 RepID=A0A7J8C953_MOLMO|nr:hypothetical protein HJG59_009982 [Molossus molossus]
MRQASSLSLGQCPTVSPPEADLGTRIQVQVVSVGGEPPGRWESGARCICRSLTTGQPAGALGWGGMQPRPGCPGLRGEGPGLHSQAPIRKGVSLGAGCPRPPSQCAPGVTGFLPCFRLRKPSAEIRLLERESLN